MNEHISFGTRFDIADISNNAVNGGNGGGSPDPLDSKTRWLYYNFWMQSLDEKVSAYHYNESLSADALQYAIWRIENEITNFSGISSEIATLAQTLMDAADSAVANSDTYGNQYVRVLNLVYHNTNDRAQDQLYVATPEPLSMILFGTGLIGIGGYVRKRFKK